MLVAETQRFELWDSCPSAVFKTAALNHSATFPYLLTPPIGGWLGDGRGRSQTMRLVVMDGGLQRAPSPYLHRSYILALLPERRRMSRAGIGDTAQAGAAFTGLQEANRATARRMLNIREIGLARRRNHMPITLS